MIQIEQDFAKGEITIKEEKHYRIVLNTDLSDGQQIYQESSGCGLCWRRGARENHEH